jgi:hypothetical protein
MTRRLAQGTRNPLREAATSDSKDVVPKKRASHTEERKDSDEATNDSDSSIPGLGRNTNNVAQGPDSRISGDHTALETAVYGDILHEFAPVTAATVTSPPHRRLLSAAASCPPPHRRRLISVAASCPPPPPPPPHVRRRLMSAAASCPPPPHVRRRLMSAAASCPPPPHVRRRLMSAAASSPSPPHLLRRLIFVDASVAARSPPHQPFFLFVSSCFVPQNIYDSRLFKNCQLLLVPIWTYSCIHK